MEAPQLELVTRLSESLTGAGIAHCHWKSNWRLDAVLSGATDLDLLVDRQAAGAVEPLLAALGFKPLLDAPGQGVPGIQHHLGWDPPSGRLVDLHLHHQLVVGHDRSKNYRLPLDRALLESVDTERGFPIPSVEVEWVVFIIRMGLKFLPWDSGLGGPSRPPPDVREEAAWLVSRCQPELVQDVLRDHLPFLDPELFERIVRCVTSETSFLTSCVAGKQLLESLRPYALRGRLSDIGSKAVGRVLRGMRRRMSGGVPKPRRAAGGLRIAFVGSDGAGKTTAIESIEGWLGPLTEVRRIHLGRPRRSVATWLIRGLLKAGRVGLEAVGQERGQLEGRVETGFPGWSRLAWAVCVARDRQRQQIHVERLATQGAIVLCDRFPLDMLSSMEAPQVARLGQESTQQWLVQAMARLEERYYQIRSAPDLIAVLKIDPELAVRRKPSDEAAEVRARASEVAGTDWSGTSAVVLDAGEPAPEVFRRLQELVWSRL